MAPSSAPRVAVIGAGMAGVSCAAQLQQCGIAVTLFEKSRGLGGRLATRRNEAGVAFDHGAQYITAHTPAFAQYLERLRGAGSAAVWQPRRAATRDAAHPWQVGTPGMSALLKPLAATLDLRTQHTVDALRRDGDGWQLRCDGIELEQRYAAVVSTAPAPQTRALLAIEPLLQQALDEVRMAPCWALMLCLREPLPVDIDAQRHDRGAIAWLARQASRPGHAPAAQAWVVHASPEWSTEHRELSADAAAYALQRELVQALGMPLPAVSFAQAHRWRYALTTRALGQPFLASTDGSLLAGGDWCLGPRVECAWQSGVAIAGALAQRLLR